MRRIKIIFDKHRRGSLFLGETTDEREGKRQGDYFDTNRVSRSQNNKLPVQWTR